MTRLFRIFVASPGDVQPEREVLPGVIEEVNLVNGAQLDYRLELVRWETHAFPGAGRPQQVINEQIGDYDAFVGIMWRRFGTPTGVAGSGTEEEYRLAYQKWQATGKPSIMFYFSQQPFMPKTLDELEQMRKVLLLRSEIGGKGLFWEYATCDEFERTVRKHFGLHFGRLVAQPAAGGAVPNDAAIAHLKGLWPRMTPELQRAFSIAYNENRLAGDGGVKTEDLFSALLRVSSPSLQEVVEEIPQTALPEPTPGDLFEKPYILEEHPWLSGCVASSVKRLGKILPAGRQLTAVDVFADIAKNGTGKSVARLREHNIGAAEIDHILRDKGISVVAT